MFGHLFLAAALMAFAPLCGKSALNRPTAAINQITQIDDRIRLLGRLVVLNYWHREYSGVKSTGGVMLMATIGWK